MESRKVYFVARLKSFPHNLGANKHLRNGLFSYATSDNTWWLESAKMSAKLKPEKIVESFPQQIHLFTSPNMWNISPQHNQWTVSAGRFPSIVSEQFVTLLHFFLECLRCFICEWQNYHHTILSKFAHILGLLALVYFMLTMSWELVWQDSQRRPQP